MKKRLVFELKFWVWAVIEFILWVTFASSLLGTVVDAVANNQQDEGYAGFWLVVSVILLYQVRKKRHGAKRRSRKKVWISAALVVAFLVILGVASNYGEVNNPSGGTHHYPSSFANSFITGCEKRGLSSDYCTCMFNNFQQKYTYSQAMKFNAQSHVSQVDVNSIRNGCKS